MFESSTISIILKVVIESIEEEFVTKIATEVATKSIEEEIVSNEKKSNRKNIFNNVALLIETKTIKATEAIESTNATDAIEATVDESTASSD